MVHTHKKTLWLRWVSANALGELLGLGGTGVFFVFIMLYISQLENQPSTKIVLGSFMIAVLSGAFEATLVGLVQWWAMQPWFPTITRRDWWLATLAGALVAYIIGYLPSTLMSLGEKSSQAPVAEPSQWIVLLLAAGMGLVAGAVLSFAQWWVLRHQVRGASLWIPANMLAWLAGMPIIFWGIDAAQQGRPPLQAALLLAVVLLLTGIVVGAIHGAFLVRLASQSREEEA